MSSNEIEGEFKIKEDKPKRGPISQIAEDVKKANALKDALTVELMLDKDRIDADNIFQIHHHNNGFCGLMPGIACNHSHCSTCNFVMMVDGKRVFAMLKTIESFEQERLIKNENINFDDYSGILPKEAIDLLKEMEKKAKGE